MIKKLFIALAFALMLINPSISIAAQSPVDVQEIFTSSKNIDGDNFKYLSVLDLTFYVFT